VVNISIPPLRERKEEIPLFVEYFLNKYSEKYQKKPKPIGEAMMKAFMAYDWTGNIRELQNIIQRYLVLGNDEEILADLVGAARQDELAPVPREDAQEPPHQPSLKQVHRDAARRAEAKIILKALEMTHFNRKKAAQLLNITYRSLLYKIRECGIKKHLDSKEP
jgi:two-component system, NtrC family, response regulator AtoC